MTNNNDPKVEFSAQISVRLIELTQSVTYEGLLEGLPTKESNAGIIAGLHQKYPGVHLLSAVETPIEWRRERPYPFGTPATLPRVQCVARMQSTEEGIYFRAGMFAWFQSEWAMPIEASVLATARTLDWLEHTTRHVL